MKMIVLLLFSALVLSAEEGYAVYKKVCASCHIEELTKKETLARFKTLKAPPMIEVANRIKHNVIIADGDEDIHRQVVIAFVKHYIEHPDIEYSMCDPMALEKFGQMPSLKGKLTDTEKQAVAEWLYDRFENKTFQ